MQTKPGTTLRSAVSDVEVVVVRAPSAPVEIRCGEAVMGDTAAAGGEQLAAGSPGDEVLLGKRYTDEQSGLELLCTKPGTGPLSCDGRPLTVRGTKPLPASD